jgi:predicted TIM-barrel fold metal-dependent hydrolase
MRAAPAPPPVAVSADSHVLEPPVVFAGLADRFGDRAPRIVRDPLHGDSMVIPAVGAARGAPVGRLALAGSRLDAASARARTGARPRRTHEDVRDPLVQARVARGYDGVRRGVLEPAARLADQEIDGVRAEVLYPSLFLALFGLSDAALVAACFRRYNDWLADFCSEAPERLVGLALIPLQDPALGRRELERALSRGFRGGCIPCRAPEGRPYRDAAYEPIWRAAEEASFPLCLHLGANGWRRSDERESLHPILGYASSYATAQHTLADVLLEGIARRHPGLRIAVAEFGAGWVANWLDRLDQGFARSPGRAAALDGPPGEDFRRQVLVTFEDDRAAIATRSLVGVDRLMWASDYPHRDSTFPESAAILDALFAGVPAADRAAMTAGNAARLFGLVESAATAAAG